MNTEFQGKLFELKTPEAVADAFTALQKSGASLSQLQSVSEYYALLLRREADADTWMYV